MGLIFSWWVCWECQQGLAVGDFSAALVLHQPHLDFHVKGTVTIAFTHFKGISQEEVGEMRADLFLRRIQRAVRSILRGAFGILVTSRVPDKFQMLKGWMELTQHQIVPNTEWSHWRSSEILGHHQKESIQYGGSCGLDFARSDKKKCKTELSHYLCCDPFHWIFGLLTLAKSVCRHRHTNGARLLLPDFIFYATFI